MFAALPVWAGSIRVATYNTELSRDGPGLLLRDIRRGDSQALAVAQVIAAAHPDILLLQNIDYDRRLATAKALSALIADAGHVFPHMLAFAPNAGLPTGYDLNADGRRWGPADAQGFGRFAGQGGMLLLSRYPFEETEDYSPLLWRDMAWTDPAAITQAWGDVAGLRLAAVGAWRVRVRTGAGPLTVLAFHAAPPVFDGPEDRNGLRNQDQLLFWAHKIAQMAGPLVLLGDANNDPAKGDGRKAAIRALLTHPRLTDPLPDRPTVDWQDLGLGWMRVDYALPSRDLAVTGAGVADTPRAEQASRHRLVWVDLMLGANAQPPPPMPALVGLGESRATVH
ncbi:Endonuclease/Exonuclease/phosphatase family protein [Thalassovita litoralis]|uniref:Endonuclease/Exonuclease/phosphatase family protein n=1 Tax=Thalassovita litoralis TaxID=1010611 RepID=A0A521AJP9_9RHOB|nr:Endonuclease/Exonuclease/phosphatase family protein [Thalassovita litoralis]